MNEFLFLSPPPDPRVRPAMGDAAPAATAAHLPVFSPILTSSQPNNTYSVYREFTTRGENVLAVVIDYFQERLNIETQYAASLEKLSNKTLSETAAISSSNISTVTEAWRRIGDYTAMLTSEHTKLSRVLDSIVDELSKEQHAQQKALKALRANVKTPHRDYAELRTHAVPKTKATYYRKCEQLEKEPKETAAATTSSKYLKMAKEVTLADQAYRSSIQYLEASLDRLQTVRDRAQTDGERIEKGRILATKSVLARYCEAETNACQRQASELESLRLYVECIKDEVDVSLHRQEFQNAWPMPDRLYYENFKTRLPAKNLVFGVPLNMALRLGGASESNGIPMIVNKCIDAIEKRGLEREGIYRVSGKLSELSELRLQLETDATAVDLLDDRYDVNVIAGLIKQYFRELPQPVFYFPPKERSEYATITDSHERISRLRSRVKALPRANQLLLRALVGHLKHVVSNSGKNKMVASNIGLLFGPVVFQGQLEFSELGAGGSASAAIGVNTSGSGHGFASSTHSGAGVGGQGINVGQIGSGASTGGNSNNWLKPFANMANAAAAAISNATNGTNSGSGNGNRNTPTALSISPPVGSMVQAGVIQNDNTGATVTTAGVSGTPLPLLLPLPPTQGPHSPAKTESSQTSPVGTTMATAGTHPPSPRLVAHQVPPPLMTSGSAGAPPPAATDTSSSKFGVDFSRFEYLKTDVVLEDLMSHMDVVFGGECGGLATKSMAVGAFGHGGARSDVAWITESMSLESLKSNASDRVVETNEMNEVDKDDKEDEGEVV